MAGPKGTGGSGNTRHNISSLVWPLIDGCNDEYLGIPEFKRYLADPGEAKGCSTNVTVSQGYIGGVKVSRRQAWRHVYGEAPGSITRQKRSAVAALIERVNSCVKHDDGQSA